MYYVYEKKSQILETVFAFSGYCVYNFTLIFPFKKKKLHLLIIIINNKIN